jgi:hypothetical protein
MLPSLQDLSLGFFWGASWIAQGANPNFVLMERHYTGSWARGNATAFLTCLPAPELCHSSWKLPWAFHVGSLWSIFRSLMALVGT